MSGDIVRGGDILTIRATPASAYYSVDTLTVVGMTENSNGTYTVTAENGNKTPFVSVSFKNTRQYNVTAETTGQGTVSFTVNGQSATQALPNAQVKVIATPANADDYELVSLTYTYDGESHNILSAKTFTMPSADVTIQAEFREIVKYAIKAEKDDIKFSVNKKEVSKAPFGATVTVDVTPPDGYVLSALTYIYDGESHDILSAKTFTMPAGEVTIQAEYMDVSNIPLVEEVASAEDLQNLALGVNTGKYNYAGKVVTLVKDIDLSGINWTPIGTGPDYSFQGTFDGNRKTIQLNIQRDEWFVTDEKNSYNYIGLFGYASNATIQDVTMEGTIQLGSEFHHPDLTGSFHYCFVGSVLGRGDNTNISGCINNVNITFASQTDVGGVVGQLDGNIENCINYGKLDGVSSYPHSIGYIGGIVGCVFLSSTSIKENNVERSIQNCGNYGSITTDGDTFNDGDHTTGGVIRDHVSGDVGGIAGQLVSGVITIRSCFNKGSMTGDINHCGGIVGEAMSGRGYTLENCYNIGDIRTDSDAGRADIRYCGLVGYLYGAGTTMLLKNCYNAGTLTAAGNDKYTGVTDEFCTVHTSSTLTKEGCLTSAEIKTLEKQKLLVESVEEFVHDTQNINGTLPHLAWELNYLSTDTFPITFTIAPASVKATVRIYSDAAMQTQIQPEKDGGYRLPMGTYYYAVSAEGYRTETGSFSVSRGAVEVEVTLRQAVQVTFQVTPAQADFVLMNDTGAVVAPDETLESTNMCSYVYTLYTNTAYNYEASCAGYASDGNNYVVTNQNATVRVTLNTSTYPGTGGSSGEETAKMIYGDSNEGTTNTIKEGGTYYLGNGNLQRGEGVITINTTQPVTLVGPGTRPSDQYSDLHIRCVQEGSKLTLQDVYISNKLGRSDPKMTNMIDFTGTGNTLTFAGTCILDQDTEATGYAMIHAGEGTELTISGGTAYMYKREQGAGIGGNGGADPNKLNGSGQSIEYNGTITIQNAKLFLKGTKEGAGIGGGAGVGSSGNPGTITIQNSTLNLITNARGAAIGAGAGKKDSLGPEVHISNSSVNINVNYSGAAIGGGGYGGEQDDTGDNMGANDSPGGTLYYGGNSSIRAYVDANAANAFGTDGAGVHNNITITADVVDESTRKPLYLLALDTQGIPAGSASAPYVVLEDGKTVYSGDLHRYGYVNEDATKYGGSSVAVSSTIANWTAGDDTCLYLYMPEGSHELTVNGVTFNAVWDAGSKSFTVTKKDESSEGPEGSEGSEGSEGTGGPSGEPGQPETPDEPATEVGGQTTVEDGVATTVVDREELLDALEKADGGPIIITADIPEDETVTETTTVLTRSDVGEIAETGASLTISSPLADIVLSTDSLWHISGEEGQEEETVTITAAVTKDGTAIEVTANGVVMEKVNGGLQVTLPVDGEELSAGSVMIVVDEKGKETVIKKSAQNKDGDGFTGLLKGSCTVKVVENAKRFQDVVSDDWFAEAVDFTSSRELFTGVTEVTFDPNGSITRAMLVTVLHRLEDTPDTALQDVFDDVPAGTWYSDAVHWASENRIVNGYSEGTFGGDDFAERQQMAAILYRYANVLGLDVSIRGDLSRFTDAELVDDYAVEAMEWAVGTGLFIGDEFGVLNPGGSASRAEAAIVLQRFIQLIMR